MTVTMLETPHALVGAAIVTKIPNPLISLPLAFASHFVLDMVPHWNPHLNTEVKKYGRVSKNSTIIILADVVLSLVSVSFMALTFANSPEHSIYVMFGAFSGILPDLLEAPYYFLKAKTQAVLKWIAFQKSIQADTTLVPGVMTQLATIVAAFWWVASA